MHLEAENNDIFFCLSMPLQKTAAFKVKASVKVDPLIRK
jgi:hypothetical protein